MDDAVHEDRWVSSVARMLARSLEVASRCESILMRFRMETCDHWEVDAGEEVVMLMLALVVATSAFARSHSP